MFLYYLIKIWKTKQSWLNKFLSRLAGLAHLHVFIRKIFISPWWDRGKIKWDLTYAGWHASHVNPLYFYKSFLRKVRSHLGELARLTGPAQLDMNSPLASFWKFQYFWRSIYNPLEHLWWSFYCKNGKPLSIFTKKLHHRCFLEF